MNLGYIKVPKVLRNKWDNKGMKLICVGYADNHKDYVYHFYKSSKA